MKTSEKQLDDILEEQRKIMWDMILEETIEEIINFLEN